MQNTRDSQFQPLGVCHRLFNFIMNGIIGRGLKRVTLGRSVSPGSTKVPVEGSSLSIGLDSIEETPLNSIQPNEEEMLQLHPVNEIVVEFRQNNGLENWNTPNDNLNSSVNGRDKNEPLLSSDHTQLQKGNGHHKERENKERKNYGAIESKEIPILIQEIDHDSNKGTSISQVEANGSGNATEEQVFSTSIGARAKGQEKSVSSTKAGADQKKEKNMKKEKYIAAERLTEQVKPKPPRHHGTLLSVIVNINEKPDEFIRKRKEDMRRNYGNIIEPKSS